MGRNHDIMCDDITCEDLHLSRVDRMDDIICEDLLLASVAGLVGITCDDLTYDDLNPECVK